MIKASCNLNYSNTMCMWKIHDVRISIEDRILYLLWLFAPFLAPMPRCYRATTLFHLDVVGIEVSRTSNYTNAIADGHADYRVRNLSFDSAFPHPPYLLHTTITRYKELLAYVARAGRFLWYDGTILIPSACISPVPAVKLHNIIHPRQRKLSWL